MRAPLLKIPIIMVLVLLVLTACLGNNPAPATPMPSDVAFTQAAKTIVAELTRNAPTPTPTSAKPSPTPTLAPARVLAVARDTTIDKPPNDTYNPYT